MKRIIFFLVCFVYSVTVFAGNINQIVFFGDSLSDNGNLYHLLFKLIPKSPPYYQGRFSNGPTWAEYVGNYYHTKSEANYKIYAVGGAVAVLHPPSLDFIAPTTLELEVDQYLIEALFKRKNHTLFSIWIGGNDYLFDQQADANQVTKKVINKIVWSMTTLMNYGAKNFLILNLPDLSRIPYAMQGSPEKLHQLTQMHNQKLHQAIEKMQAMHPDVSMHLIDIYSLFNEVMADPKKYNEKYKTHITNTTEACWKGSYTLSRPVLDQELQRWMDQQAITSDQLDVQTLGDFLVSPSSLSYTYSMGRGYGQGNVPCANANDYLFWDQIHPTATTHQVLGQVVIETLGGRLS